MGRVAVVGGGPAGSTAATLLAGRGHDVVLFERERFPRDHIGESLLPASLPVLDALGVLPAVQEAGFLRKWGATMVWGTDREPWSWYFRETNSQHPHAFQVWRPTFDKILLDNSRDHGVDVREGHRVSEVVFEDGTPRAVRVEPEGGRAATVEVDFVVDASGQAALLGRHLDLRQWDPYFRNMAVYAYFEGGRRLPPPDETNILVESYENGWFWTIPLHLGWLSVGAVVDRDIAQQGVRGGALGDFLLGELALAERTRQLVDGARMVRGPHSIRDWSYRSDRMAGEGYVLVGDAACFVDPLFSSGVHLALTGGVLASALVSTWLSDAELGRAAAPVYQQLYELQYDRFHEMARLFYSSNRTTESYFWEARRLLGGAEGGSTPRQDFVRAVAGQPPAGYERAVLAQGALPEEFVVQVAAAEQRLADRRRQVGAGRDRLAAAVPVLAPGVAVRRQPVLGDGEFVWGEVLVSAERPEGVPCSRAVSDLLRRVDGRRTVADLVGDVVSRYPEPARGRLAADLASALATLYVDGAVAEMTGL